MWHNPEAWIAIGVSVGFVVVGVVMHRVFVNVLKNESPESEKKAKHE
ncbi:hypothetical protein [Limnohabitans sp. TS-CS-82]|jgi:hypothetical protein|nr:hypothetical protein [Limnohabitans sp. TS-CS-82]